MVNARTIKQIPGDQGFRKVSSESMFLQAAYRLEHLGVDAREVESILSDLYNATVHEISWESPQWARK